MPRTASARRIDLHLSEKDAERLEAIQAAREDQHATDTLRALVREDHRRLTAARRRRRAEEPEDRG